MRTFLAVLAALTVGAVLAFVLLRDDGEGDDDAGIPPTPSHEAELEANPHLLAKTGTLVIRVRAPDGSVPSGTEVGYEAPGRRRKIYYAGKDGRRRFADAPLGPLVVVATAPDHEEATEARELLAGVPMEVILTLKPVRSQR